VIHIIGGQANLIASKGSSGEEICRVKLNAMVV